MKFKYTIPLLLFAVSFYFCDLNKEADSPEVPNVIVIMTDDQGYGDVGEHGNPYIKTPELDKLHNETIRFTDFHVNPFCSPTRAALMTGRFSDRTHVRTTINLTNHLNRSEKTMAEYFKASGYATGHFGKWHLGENYPYRPIDRGFDEWVGIGDGGLATACDYWENDRMNDGYNRNGEWEKIEGFNTDVFFNETMSFIERNKEQPFFVYLATNVPHGPLNVPLEWREEYLQGMDSLDADTKEKYEKAIDFFASITRIDQNIGKLRNFLEEKGLAENTIIVFLTDNGGTGGVDLFNAGMRGKKGSVYDGGHRVPCFFYYPAAGYNKARDVEALTMHLDLLPTFIELCDLKIPQGTTLPLDGRSLVPLLEGKNDWDDRLIILHSQNIIPAPVKGENALVATEKWRLVNNKELYDINADPGQKSDVSADFPEVVKELTAKYEHYWDEELHGMDYPYARPVIGAPEMQETWLNTASWVRDPDFPQGWHQGVVRGGTVLKGYWPVEIARDGTYRFEVRRWPKEVNMPIRASLPAHSPDDLIRNGKPVNYGEGKALPVKTVQLQVGDQQMEKAVEDGTIVADFEMQLKKGPVDISSSFIMDDGTLQSAYYIYASPLIEN